MDESDPLCRICHSNTSPPDLIRPCSCRGTMRHVHAGCLEEWVLRRMKDGVPVSSCIECEICRESYEHVIATPHPLTFLFGWQRWAHLGYMLFVGRRIISELRSAARTATKYRPSGKSSRRELASGVAFSVLMAAHYAVFFVVDARHLLIQYRRWRAASAQVQILDKQPQVPDCDAALDATGNV